MKLILPGRENSLVFFPTQIGFPAPVTIFYLNPYFLHIIGIYNCIFNQETVGTTLAPCFPRCKFQSEIIFSAFLWKVLCPSLINTTENPISSAPSPAVLIHPLETNPVITTSIMLNSLSEAKKCGSRKILTFFLFIIMSASDKFSSSQICQPSVFSFKKD